jgi:large repetitive protein
VNGATGLLEFDWNDDALDGIQNPTGLGAGTYTVLVTDEEGCTATATVTLGEPDAIALVCAEENPVSAIGANDGSATVAISGGTAGYTIDWSGPVNGSATLDDPGTATITDLEAGTYTVLVTDANGCEATCTFTITEPSNCNITLDLTGTDPLCNGGTDGEITLVVNGATGLLEFDWNDDALDGIQNPTGLGAGTYTVLVTDEEGCTATATVTLGEPDAIALVCAEENPVSAIGANDGSATVAISGGTAGYTIDWSGPVNGSATLDDPGTATITDLEAGTYTVLVTDANGCEATCTFTITEPSNCNITLDLTGTDPLCNGGTDGEITLVVNGATGLLEFDWNDDALDGIQNPTGLGAGTYTVLVTDEEGCTATATVTLGEPDAIALVCAEENPVSAIGANDGSATVAISGGTAGYTIDWSGPVSGSATLDDPGTATITDLEAGTYTVLVTDANGCEATCTFTITEPSNCNITLDLTGTDPLCNGGTDGEITLVVNGATGLLEFDWNDDALDGIQNPTGLGAGTYTVLVTDEEGCTATATVTLGEPDAIALVCAEENPVSAIGANDGSATVAISGGTAGYTIDWSGPVNGSATLDDPGTATITDLEAGTYTVLVTDANGCEATCTFTITEPSNCNITLDLTGTDPLCNGGTDGEITLVVNGATGLLEFDWNDDALDGIQNPSGLSAGIYLVLVTDEEGCTATATVTLGEPDAIALVCAEENPVSAIGANDGSATVAISGGTAGYTIDWSGPVNGSATLDDPGTATITDLEAGTYTVLVTDANGCEATCSFTITEPTCNISLNISGTNPVCNGSTNGSISLTVNNATGALTFDWNDNALDGIQNPTGLSAGTYTVIVTDAAGCTASASVTLTAPAALALVCAQQNPVSTVGGNNGSATVAINGGTAPYTVAWSGAANGSQMQMSAGTATITDLEAGTYTVLVTDANGCEATCTFTITEPTCNISLNISGTNPVCNGGMTGSINLTVNNATGALTFDWNVNALDGIQNPTGLSAGTYTVIVTDAAGCTASASVTLTAPAALALVCAQQNPVSTVGGNNGSATVVISGGTAPYTVAWSGAANGSQMQMSAGTATITDLEAGTYTVLVTDANGCEATCTFTITEPTCNISLNISGTNPVCNGGMTGSINLTVNNATGALTFDWNVNALDGIQNPTGLSAGTYTVIVTDAAGCTATTSVTLTDPMAVSLVATGTGADCFGNAGIVTIESISGGTAPYGVSVNGVFQAELGTLPAVLDDFAPGSYVIAVEDANGCRAQATVVVPLPQVYTLNLGPERTIRLGDSVLLEGVANFVIDSVVWTPDATLSDPGNPASFARPAATTTYTLLAFDANGCSAQATVRVVVDKEPRVFIPNAFSPNDDNINDVFMIFTDSGVVQVRAFRVFDRWGNMLFQNGPFPPNDPLYGWDGRFKGRLMNAGVYVYAAEVEFFDGRLETLSGEVTLMR